jgi:hypothetical protein
MCTGWRADARRSLRIWARLIRVFPMRWRQLTRAVASAVALCSRGKIHIDRILPYAKRMQRRADGLPEAYVH